MPNREFYNPNTKVTYTLSGIQNDLPEDIFQVIATYLDPKAIGRFQIASRFCRDIYKPILSQTPIARFIEMVQVQNESEREQEQPHRSNRGPLGRVGQIITAVC